VPGPTLRLAHRGDWRRAPENSLAAFAAALAIPACDGLEFDVRASSDGIPVICHDATLARTHGRPDRIDALTAAALEALGVPTLAEVLTAVGRRPFLDVELKEVLGPSVVELLAGARGPGLTNAVVSSFEVAALERIGHLAPSWPRWLNSHTLNATDIETALGIGCRGIAANWRALDRRSVARAQASGLEVASYTVRRRATFDRLARLGVVAVCVEAGALEGRTT
jgi:glycerophosphoryl diester phosphodiesterase